jgi:hypothetical protein
VHRQWCFPAPHLGFPAPFEQGNGQKAAWYQSFSALTLPCGSLKNMIFPAFSLLAGKPQIGDGFGSDWAIRHAVPISPFAVPAITKKRAFAGQYRDLRAPEIAIESPAPVENCALFSDRKWLGALSILIASPLPAIHRKGESMAMCSAS